MIKIDGSEGEAGGSILRVALACSSITKKPFEIINIRAKRPKKGLKQQHLTSVRAIQKITSAEVEGADIESERLKFKPGEIIAGNYKFDIGTAGSITLLLQSLIPILIKADRESKISVTGGTDVSWSPGYDYFEHIFLSTLNKLGIEIESKLVRHGFYPKGNGKVELKIKPCRNIKELNLLKRGKLEKIDVHSIASLSLKKKGVAERQANELIKNLSEKFNIARKIYYVDSLSDGSSLNVHAHYENCVLGASSLGERGKTSENVGKECSSLFLEEINSEATVDSKLADQILIYIALAGKGSFITSKLTNHLTTNISVIERFLDVKFEIENLKVSCKMS